MGFRMHYAKCINHRNNEITAKCCICLQKKRLHERDWYDHLIGGDLMALKCTDCAIEEMQRED